jgi:hypothetical protein
MTLKYIHADEGCDGASHGGHHHDTLYDDYT